MALCDLPPPKPAKLDLGGPAKMRSFWRARLNFMYYSYVLLCVDNKRKRQKFYIGTTEDLRERITAHKTKSVKTTKSFDKISLIYYECCLNKTDAIKREHQLKTGFGRGYINRRVENYLKNSRV